MNQTELNFLHEWIRAHVNAPITSYIATRYLANGDRADRAFNALLKFMTQLQERLVQDGQHRRGCGAAVAYGKEEDCDCGLQELIGDGEKLL